MTHRKMSRMLEERCAFESIRHERRSGMKIAIVRGVPETFSTALRQREPETPIDVQRAQEQHHRYVEVLRTLVDRVIEIPADDRFPDCCFVEDTAVVIGDRGVVTRPGAPSRQGEEEAVAEVLCALGTTCLQMPEGATLDGGDVLFTGQELFVGRSRRTNDQGIAFLAEAFPEFPLYPIDLPSGLHLKSVVTQIDEHRFSLYRGANSIFAEIERVNPEYHAIMIPDAAAANCLVIGRTILHLAPYPESASVFASLGLQMVPLEMSELSKADGGLTCLSILLGSSLPPTNSVPPL
ncbi:MAG: hypothetical protein D6812_16105 [Deltaproteobacteria bacterium]|nr:MAG: hypothetical protein D6812_16105 [Deltaproteobacteria bacterium]